MHQFITLTALLGSPVTVNLSRIISIAPTNGMSSGTALKFGYPGDAYGDGYILVREDYEHVASLCSPFDARRQEATA